MVALSVVIPVRDELPQLAAMIAGIEHQVRQPDEVVVADGCSSDGSREWLESAARSRPWLRVVDNPAGSVPAGLNAALRASSGDLVARMDAHADYHPTYLGRLVDLLEERPDVVAVGGSMATVGRGPAGRAIAATLSRRVGMGGARHRCGQRGGPIDHVFTGCYRRSAIEAVGGYDPRLLANEDFEMDARLRERGGIVWLEPSARCSWYVRESVRSLARQMWRYGYHKALTIRLHPGSVRARQLAPPGLIVALGAALVLHVLAGLLLATAYLVCSGAVGARAARADGGAAWRGLVVPTVVHVCWGAGLLAGLVRFMPARRRPRAEPAVAGSAIT